MKSKNKRWLRAWIILWTYLQLLYCEANDFRNLSNSRNGNNTKEMRGLFSPRMDYEQWKPILNGDPLKNDPTFDYVPPMVEAVRYWRDTSHRKPENPNQKKDILVLGVSSKKPSTSSSVPENPNRREYFDPFLKFVKETPYKETTYTYHRHRQHLPITSPYFTPSNFLNKLTERPPIKDESIPYTMLLPPPVPSQKLVTEIPKVPSPSSTSVTVDHANLIYQSSTHGLTDWLMDKYTTSETKNIPTWHTPSTQEPILNNIIDKHEQNSFLNKTENILEEPMKMHKGQVEDDDLDTYVNIGKLEAHMDSPSGMGISGITVKPPNIVDMLHPISVPNLSQEIVNPMFTPKRTLEKMQTMQPPKKDFQLLPIRTALQNEISLSSEMITTVTTTLRPTTTPTLTPKPTTTTASPLTTDPLFKHYKQSMEPIRGPLYLIIQGHSKVKTYGPSKQIHGISIQETNEIPTAEERDFEVKHLHRFKKEHDDKEKVRRGRSGNLQTLKHVLQTRLGAIDFQEIEREIEYKVSSEEDVSEKYQKGIVEAGAMRRKRVKD